jgi:hypothetical protein
MHLGVELESCFLNELGHMLITANNTGGWLAPERLWLVGM